MINIKNYTTEVPAITSVNNIEKLLIDFGATNIMKEIEGGRVVAISFRILIKEQPFAFKLPADVKQCYVWLQQKTPKRKPEFILAQAERLAWKHQFEWLFIQLTSITLAQMEPLQALLPYAYDAARNQTFYEKLKESNFQNLLTNGQ